MAEALALVLRLARRQLQRITLGLGLRGLEVIDLHRRLNTTAAGIVEIARVADLKPVMVSKTRKVSPKVEVAA